MGFPTAFASAFLPLEVATASFSSFSALAFSAALSAESGPSIVARKSSSVREAINMEDDEEADEEEEEPAANAAAEFAAREPAAPSPDDKDEALLKMATPPSLADRCAQRDSPRAEGGRSEADNADDDEDEEDDDEEDEDEEDEGTDDDADEKEEDETEDAEGRFRDGTTVLALVPAVDGFLIDCDCDSSFTAVELNGSASSSLSPTVFVSPPDAIRAMTGGLDLAPIAEADDDAENEDADARADASALDASPAAVAVAAVEPAAAATVFLSPPDLSA
jgi:hypothetical protein